VAPTAAFAADAPAFAGTGARPAAFKLGKEYEVTAWGRPTALVLAHQGTREALALGLPETRTAIAASVGLNHRIALSLEWARSSDYGVDEGGTGGVADEVTFQLAAEF
jgi:antitoxin (DNA-binding transcriptional repressor) of toxin-antitoxin stability system